MTNRRLIALSLLAASALTATPAAAQRVDRIVAFGDSYADDGNLFQIIGGPLPAPYSTGRFSGGTNYVDTLSSLLDAPVDNFAIGGALTNNTNTNSPLLPGFVTEWNAFLAGGGGPLPTVSGTLDENDLVTVSIGGNDARFYQQNGGTAAGAPAAATGSTAFATAESRCSLPMAARSRSRLARASSSSIARPSRSQRRSPCRTTRVASPTPRTERKWPTPRALRRITSCG